MKLIKLVSAGLLVLVALTGRATAEESSAKFFRQKIYFGSKYRLLPSLDEEILSRASFAREVYLIHPFLMDLNQVLFNRGLASEAHLPDVGTLRFFSVIE